MKTFHSISRLFAWPTFLLTVTLVCATSSRLRADIVLETFDGPLDPTFWSLSTGGNEWQVSGGKLVITRNNATNGNLAFIPNLIGDFDVQFDYQLSWSSTFGFGDRIQLGLLTDAAPIHGYFVGHAQEGFIFGVASDPSARFGFGPNVPSGKMRVTRAGSDISMQYWNAVNWVTLQTGTDSRDMRVRLDNYIFNSFTPGSSVEIDNFYISADQIGAVPEPGSCLGLLVGLVLAASIRRRSG